MTHRVTRDRIISSQSQNREARSNEQEKEPRGNELEDGRQDKW